MTKKNKGYIRQNKVRKDNLRREQYSIILSFLNKNSSMIKNKKVLDFGAGNGEFSLFLKNKGTDVECFEPNSNSQKRLSSKGLRVVHKLKRERYDSIFLLDVIEHLVEPKKVLTDLYNSLKKGGKIIITTPDHLYWKLRIKFLLGDIRAFEYPNAHLSFFSKKSLGGLMDSFFKKKTLKSIGSKVFYVGEK